jgi:hypothetical protein
MTHTVADQMVEILSAPGVERIFHGIVGGSLNGFDDALRQRGGSELSALIEALVQRAVDTPETKLPWDRSSSISSNARPSEATALLICCRESSACSST